MLEKAPDFKNGDTVILVNRGSIYPSHVSAAQNMRLDNWSGGHIPRDSPRDRRAVYTVKFTIVGCYVQPYGEIIYGVQHPDGSQYIVGVSGIEHYPDFDSGSMIC